ncbi:MAG: hypothetical protein V2I54_11960 [Bacteroidales bacterium]|jgi:hypothetical protein|nr:hypothetical protein [Bacteroidales bacterium]
MKKNIALLVFLILMISPGVLGQQQDQDKNTDSEETQEPYFFWGGNLWLAFGSLDMVDINILFGNQITERLSVGISAKYQYYNDERKGFDPALSSSVSFKAHTYGGSTFLQFAVIKDFREIFPVKMQSGIIAHAEYELLNTSYNYVYFNSADTDRNRYWLHNILLGGGYYQQLGKKARSWIILLWNVNETDDNPFEYPQFRIGFSVAF